MPPLLRLRPLGLLLFASAAAGCADSRLPVEEEPALVPACAEPIPVKGTFDSRAPGYIVLYHPGTDATVATEALSASYHFTPTHLYTATPGFAGLLEPEALVGIQCAPEVMMIEHDGVVFVD